MTSSLSAVIERVQQLLPASGTPVAAPTGQSFATVLDRAGSAKPAGSAEDYAPALDAAATRYGLDPRLLRALIEQESGFDPNATSSAGAAGLTQLMPSTAASLGVSNPYDPVQSIDGGARYLAEQLSTFGGDVSSALAAYNAGPAAVKSHGGVPPYAETTAYVRDVLARYQQLVAQGGGE